MILPTLRSLFRIINAVLIQVSKEFINEGNRTRNDLDEMFVTFIK